jgi:predicted nuclease with TOPRIM domain
MPLDYPALFALIGSLIALIGTAVAATQRIEGKFTALRAHLNNEAGLLRAELQELKSTVGICDTRDLSKVEMLEYRINANTELINHRSQRFTEELNRRFEELSKEISELELFLEKTTTFNRRGNCP